MKRRKFITLIGLGTLLAAFIGWFIVPRIKGRRSAVYEPDVLSKICDRKNILQLGKKYRLKSGENDRAELLALLGIQANQNVAQQVSEMVRSDFENQRIVLVDGWLLSITEARQCALLSLIEDL